ncbi:hypothetical protein LSAT2_021695, partial [Lamellibrachia satsuma]
IRLQGQIKYPPNILYGKTVKRAVAARLVAPVRTAGDHVFAFRVIWRVDHDRLAHAWDDIVSQRHLCDQAVAKQIPSLEMFVSCISGVFTRTVRGKADAVAGPVFPAVSYWVVCHHATPHDFGELAAVIRARCPDVDVKLITSLRRQKTGESLDAKCGTLFAALKDHNSGFVRQKITRSLSVAGIHALRSNAKVVVVAASKYLPQMPLCVEALQIAGLFMEMDVLKGTE